MTKDISDLIKSALKNLGLEEVDFVVEQPTDFSHGDYATNVAMVLAASNAASPKELAEKIRQEIEKIARQRRVSLGLKIAGPGFINFTLSKEFFAENLQKILKEKKNYGKNDLLKGQKTMVEYTDPNVMKPFHIGHLMTNAIGESLSGISEFCGAEVKRANYYSDAGLGIAKAVWAMIEMKDKMPNEGADIIAKTDFLGKAYAFGVKEMDKDKDIEQKIREINKKLYDRSDEQLNKLYDTGKKWSLEHFEILYEKLDSKFDYFFPESEVSAGALDIVKNGLKQGIFEESEGATIFKGEDCGLHTRVFVNSEGLPTYEAKELELNKQKYDKYNFDQSIIITANEQNDYFKVVLKVIEKIFPEIAEKTNHIGHGMMRFSGGKMSSREGNVVTGEELISRVEELALEKMKESNFEKEEKQALAEKISIGAIRYSILKQSIGKDIIFDFEKSLSFEGDSGPYLQYSFARAQSVLRKAEDLGLKPHDVRNEFAERSEVERMLVHFPEIVLRGAKEYAPQYVTTYLTELASAFNTYYAKNKIVDPENKELSEYRLALTSAVAQVLENGLNLLGITAVERM